MQDEELASVSPLRIELGIPRAVEDHVRLMQAWSVSDLPVAFVERRLTDKWGRAARPSTIEQVLEPDELILWELSSSKRYFAFAIALSMSMTLISAAGAWYAFSSGRLLLLAVCVLIGVRSLVVTINRLLARRRYRVLSTETRLFAQLPDPQYLIGTRAFVVLLPRLDSVRMRRDLIDRLANTASLVLTHRDSNGVSEETVLFGLVSAEDVGARILAKSPLAIDRGVYRVLPPHKIEGSDK
jgi:hypothetical protein